VVGLLLCLGLTHRCPDEQRQAVYILMVIRHVGKGYRVERNCWRH
jgi:hypothetical protein